MSNKEIEQKEIQQGDNIIFKNKGDLAWKRGQYVSSSYSPEGRKYVVIYEKRKIEADECRCTPEWIIETVNK
tara:strand:- start:9403 stop:9618 length:216 start_codon:yes stop_codon:yes gene_type:complete